MNLNYIAKNLFNFALNVYSCVVKGVYWCYYQYFYLIPGVLPENYTIQTIKCDSKDYYCIKLHGSIPKSTENKENKGIKLAAIETKNTTVDYTDLIRLYAGPNGDFWGLKLPVYLLEYIIGKHFNTLVIMYDDGEVQNYDFYDTIN
jgi:hypothetical protein